MIFKRLVKLTVLIFCGIFISGCLRFPSVKQINLVINYSDNQSLIEDKLKKQSSQFKHILADVKHNALRQGSSKEQMFNKYGEPVVLFKNKNFESVKETWLYRDPVKYSDTDRVYLYFSQDGELISWEYKPAKEQEGVK